MADTGSNDGSHDVARKYADILFDFPWINDFAAARNAVMDRCSGGWYFSVDADEWLDNDISEITDTLLGRKLSANVGTLIVRNYKSPDLDDNYADFVAFRLFRMSTGLRFEGAIHERVPFENTGNFSIDNLPHTILHHDGYVGLQEAKGKSKRERNIIPLRKLLKENPDNLRVIMEYVESGQDEKDYLKNIRHAVALIRKKSHGWNTFGPPLMRYAIIIASERNLPELNDWLDCAEKLFANSLFFKIDITYLSFKRNLDLENFEACAELGEKYIKASREMREERKCLDELSYGSLIAGNPYWERAAMTYLSGACLEIGRYTRCKELLSRLDFKKLEDSLLENLERILPKLHMQSNEDTSQLIIKYWEALKPKKRKAFLSNAALSFSPDNRLKEMKKPGFCRHSFTLYAPLADKCELGKAALIEDMSDPIAIYDVLKKVEDWNWFSVHTLVYALGQGAALPPVDIRIMDSLARRIAKNNKDDINALAMSASLSDPRSIRWAKALITAAVQICIWDSHDDIRFLRRLAEIEKLFLPLCYSKDAMKEENLFLLSEIDRFGWYLIAVFEAFDRNALTIAAILLRKALNICPSLKAVIAFMTQEINIAYTGSLPSELLTLAEKVRAILSAYDADDPAVEALKQSPAYQKVAWLIEDTVPAANPLQ